MRTMTTEEYKDFEFPAELYATPKCLVGLVGLDVQNNSNHKCIWETFTCSRAADRLPLRFVFLPSNAVFIPPKSKRTSYEWYIPKGILKRNWINKHLNILPSLVVLFYDLEWNDPHFLEKVSECASFVRSIRTSSEGRNYRVVVVLVQKNTLPLVGVAEETLSTERLAESLCQACDIGRSGLFLLQLGEHLQGYVIRLESAFYDLAQTYYQQQIRNVKSHSDHLNKTTHNYLFVRHQFKIAFLNELKQDPHTARKHYTQAYPYLSEIRLSDANIYEVKVVAAFIVYKLCKLHFMSNQAREAVTIFSTHVQKYKDKIGSCDLIFEHYAWLAKQFEAFGDLFEEATKQGLPAVQSRHPGFYYEEAAEYAVRRKRFAYSNTLQDIIVYPSPDPLAGSETVEFYGQRLWKQAKQSDTIDAVIEQQAVIALQYREKFIVKHSATITGYYGKSISQFKLYRSPRKARHLVVLMAEEYFLSSDYGKALTLLTHMLREYRLEKWWTLITHLIRTSLKCAFLTASIQEYIELCIEAASLYPTVEEKMFALNNVYIILKGLCPKPEPDLPMESDSAKLWAGYFQSASNKEISVDMKAITSFIHCKVRLEEATSDGVTVDIYFWNEGPALDFSEVSFSVMTPKKNSEFLVESIRSGSVCRLESNVLSKFRYQFAPNAADVGSELNVVSVTLVLENQESGAASVRMRFSGDWNESEFVSEHVPSTISLRREYNNFYKIKPVLNTTVMPRNCNVTLSVDHQPPALVAEWYPMKITVKNNDSAIYHCKMQIQTSPVGSTDVVYLAETTDVTEDVNVAASAFPYDTIIGDIRSKECLEKILFVRCRSIGSRKFSIKVTFNIESGILKEYVECTKEDSIVVDSVNVFEVTASFFSKYCQNLEQLYANEPILTSTNVDCISPWPVIIDSTAFKFNDGVNWNVEHLCQLSGFTVSNGETVTEVISVTVDSRPEATTTVPLGIYTIFWRRADQPSCSTRTDIQLPEVKVMTLPIYIDVDLPVPGTVKTPFTMRLTIYNNSSHLIPFTVIVDHSDAFMVSGNKQALFSVLPGSSHLLLYNMLPLHTGVLSLPAINVKVNNDIINQNDLLELLKRTLPNSLFVLPKRKIAESTLDEESVP